MREFGRRRQLARADNPCSAGDLPLPLLDRPSTTADAGGDRVRAGFRSRFGRPPEVVVRAPGRINLIGAHVDHHEGWVLPGAIDRSVWLAAARIDRPTLDLVALDLDQRQTVSLEDPPLPPAVDGGGWWSYPHAVAAALEQQSLPVCGLEAVYGGDLPRAAGVSSSAAVEVAFALAWQTLGRWLASREQLAAAARRAENTYLGVQSGIMDQLASLCGQEGHLLLLDCRDLSYRPIALPRKLVVLVADSGVRRRLAGSAFNERRKQTLSALDHLRRTRPELRSLRDITVSDFDSLARGLPPLSARRARHVVEECARVRRCAAALEGGDLDEVAALVRASHESSRHNQEVSLPELDELAAAAWPVPGCYGARLSGGGFGGCVTALTHVDAVDDVAGAMTDAFAGRFHRRPEIFGCAIADGASVEQHSSEERS